MFLSGVSMSRAELISAVRALLLILESLLFLMSLPERVVEASVSMRVEYSLISVATEVDFGLAKSKNAASSSATAAPAPAKMNFLSSGFLAGAAS